MRILAAITVIAGGIAGTIAAVIYLTSPRMYVQPHVRAYQRAVPPLPAGIVPVDSWPPIPSADEAKTVANLVPASAESQARGKIYYEYYCIFCHGDKGDGNGPVGESYTPIPTDLRSDKIKGYSDGQLFRTMLTGIGHEPVLERVVLPEHRWYLVQYVRTLGASE